MRGEAVALPMAGSRAPDFVALAKPRLNLLVVATACVGFYLGAGAGPLDVLALSAAVLGTALMSAGSAALNQLYERDIDALMLRTRSRPLPSGRVRPHEAAVFGAIASVAGLVCLAAGANALAAAVALLTLASYLAVYTPLKRVTPLSTLIGAVPGALPPVIGWAAARGSLGPDAWALFGIVFVWQIPHFYAIAWLCRDDYTRASLPILTVLDADGRRTAACVVIASLVLLPVSVSTTVTGLTGAAYAWGAIVLGIGFAVLAARFGRERSTLRARALFFGSLVYLPALWVLMIVYRTPVPAG